MTVLKPAAVSWTIQHENVFGNQKTPYETQDNHVDHGHHIPIKVYKFRWYILFTECMLNLTNSFMFSSYAPVANYTNQYYGSSATDYLSMIFLGVSVPAMVVAICVAERTGVRLLIVSSAFMNALGAGIRILSNLNNLNNETRLTLVLLGQAFGALANPGTLFLNTTIAATWFPISQRALATALLSVATPLGMLITSPLASVIVHNTADLLKLNVVIFIPSALVFLMTLAIRRSKPPTAPSHTSSLELHVPLGTFTGIKKTLSNQAYLVLLLCIGIGLGLFNTLYTMISQILCSRGYSNGFSSLTFALLIAGGLIGSTITGIVLGKTKRFEEAIKISVCGAVLSGIFFAEMAILPNKHTEILISMFFFGTFSLTCYTVSMESSAEITYPVQETTSSGILGLVGQLFGVFLIAVWNKLCVQLPDYLINTQKCTVSGQSSAETQLVAQDMTIPLFVYHTIGAIFSITLVVFFKPKYLRLEQEINDIKLEETLDNTLSNGDINANSGVVKF